MIRFDTRGMLGRVDLKSTVTTNDPEHSTVNLMVHSKVMIPLRAEPSTLVFQDVDRNADALQGTITLKRGDGGPIKPHVIGKGKRGFETAIREIEPGERYELEVTIPRPYPNGPMKAPIQLGTGIEAVPSMFVNVLADIPLRVRLLPKQFSLPALIEEPFEQSIELEWVGTTAYKVLRVESNIAELTAQVEEKDGRQVVVLHAPPGYQRTRGTFPRVTIHTDDPELPVLLVPVNTVQRSRG